REWPKLALVVGHRESDAPRRARADVAGGGAPLGRAPVPPPPLVPSAPPRSDRPAPRDDRGERGGRGGSVRARLGAPPPPTRPARPGLGGRVRFGQRSFRVAGGASDPRTGPHGRRRHFTAPAHPRRPALDLMRADARALAAIGARRLRGPHPRRLLHLAPAVHV